MKYYTYRKYTCTYRIEPSLGDVISGLRRRQCAFSGDMVTLLKYQLTDCIMQHNARSR